MRIKTAARLGAAAVLGASTVLLPAAAGSEAVPTVTAYNAPGIYGPHSWEPTLVHVEPGGAVQISNTTSVPHGVHWLSAPATPVCTGVDGGGGGEPESGANWSGSCTFSAAGSYTFDCSVHGAEMKGKVTVGPEGLTPPPSAPITTTTGTTAPPTTSDTTGAAVGPLLAGSASNALQLAGAHGGRLRVVLNVAQAGAGSRLELAAFAPRAALGRHHGPSSVQVAHLLRASLAAGRDHFQLALSPAARRALHHASRLHLLVKLRLTPVAGAALTLTRRLTVRSS